MLFKQFDVACLINFGFFVITAGVLLLLILNSVMVTAVWTVMLPFAIILSGISFIFGNVMTLALSECRHMAGTAGALYSTVQVLVAGVLSFIASKVPSDSVLPMGWLFFAVTAFALGLIFTSRKSLLV